MTLYVDFLPTVWVKLAYLVLRDMDAIIDQESSTLAVSANLIILVFCMCPLIICIIYHRTGPHFEEIIVNKTEDS
jgi:hypothetical protein